MPDRFDLVVVVDWSAANGATSARNRSNSIWIGAHGIQTSEAHFRTRATAESHLQSQIERTIAEGRRALIGFDFAFGYPNGFAKRLTGLAAAKAVWEWLAGQIKDDAMNHNNRFDLANRINAGFGGQGPFWSHPVGRSYAHLPTRKTRIDFAALGLAERRAVDRVVPAAKSVWMLSNPGAVGSQTLLGLPMIHRLSQIAGVAVWPFDQADAPVVLAEVYPSLLGKAVGAEVTQSADEKDRAQVRLLARALYTLGQRSQLSTLFQLPDAASAQEEGWILGAGDAAGLLMGLQ